MTLIEVTLLLDLGDHAPGEPLGLARSIASRLMEDAEEVATTAAEAAGSDEVHAARPVVRYRAGTGTAWSQYEYEEEA